VRVGDPTNQHDLCRVGAHRATAILISDGVEEADAAVSDEARQDLLESGNTLRTLLALRYVLFRHREKDDAFWNDLRIVVQLSRPVSAIDAARFYAPNGSEVVIVMNLGIFLNNVLFNSIAYPGFAHAIEDFMGFSGAAVRLRAVSDFPYHQGTSIVGKKFGQLKFVFENAVLVGVVGKRISDSLRVSNTVGFAPRFDRVVQKDDYLMFLSDKSLPTFRSREQQEELVAAKTPRVSKTTHDTRETSSVLVCGWRPEWNSPHIFGKRLVSFTRSLKRGSDLHFLCMCRHFQDLMRKAEGVCPMTYDDAGSWSLDGGIVIVTHTHGDAADYKVLEEVLKRPFNKAVIMSPMANRSLPPADRDTRMMGIMLFMRHIHQGRAPAGWPALHILGENALDSTAQIALAPENVPGACRPDFVNTHGILATALCSALTFPRTSAALRQLFSDHAVGAPHLAFRSVLDYVDRDIVVDTDERFQLTFVEVLKAVARKKETDVCLGVRHSDTRKTTLAPALSELLTFGQKDQLLLITRTPKRESVFALSRVDASSSLSAGRTKTASRTGTTATLSTGTGPCEDECDVLI